MWIVGLIAFYIVINAKFTDLDLITKALVYAVVLAMLGIYWIVQKKKIEADKDSAQKVSK